MFEIGDIVYPRRSDSHIIYGVPGEGPQIFSLGRMWHDGYVNDPAGLGVDVPGVEVTLNDPLLVIDVMPSRPRHLRPVCLLMTSSGTFGTALMADVSLALSPHAH